ncbi:MAG TPA: ribonuclease H [Anaeromyxobacteraceae bacterium]|nr:ribonuclease H [Anaeromyxobacteraceae bacterium]
MSDDLDDLASGRPASRPPGRSGQGSSARPSAPLPRFVAFVDGSSLQNPGGPGGTGYVVVDRSRPALRFGGTRWTEDGGHAVTNNRMELRAALEALDGLPPGEAVDVVSDSRYVVDALSRWIHGWRRRGWTTAAGGPVLNRDLIESLDSRARALSVRWSWVRGHDGHSVNEIVDALAQSAARGLPGPTEPEVVAALRAAAVLPEQER